MSCQLIRFLLADDKEEIISDVSFEVDAVRGVSNESETEKTCMVSFKDIGYGLLKPIRVWGNVEQITNQVNSVRKGN